MLSLRASKVWFCLLCFLTFWGCDGRSTTGARSNKHKLETTQADTDKTGLSLDADEEFVDSQAPTSIDAKANLPEAIDLASAIDRSETTAKLGSMLSNKAVLSDFASATEQRIIRVSMSVKSSRGGLISVSDLEERVWNMLVAQAPQPYVLRRSEGIDAHDIVWGNLRVNFKRQQMRLRRASKTASLRANYSFEFSMVFNAPKELESSWNGWNLVHNDEHGVEDERRVNENFLARLEREMPTLTVVNIAQTQNWLRAQGIFADVVTSEYSKRAMPVADHRYFDEGCVLYREGEQFYMRYLLMPFSKSRPLSMPKIQAMHCSRDATFVVAQSGLHNADLYYQASGSLNAYKMRLNFEQPPVQENVKLIVDDDLLCLFLGFDPKEARTTEVQCFNRKTGLMRWRTRPLPGALRALAIDDKRLVLANEQALISMTRQGQVEYARPLESQGRRKHAKDYCQSGKILVFSPKAGRHIAFDIEKQQALWSIDTIESSFLHCGLKDSVILSEAGGYLLAIDIQTGQARWKYRSVKMPKDALSFGANLYLLMDKAIIALDLVSGKRVAEIPLHVEANSIINIGGRIFLDTAPAIYALSAY